MHIVYYISSHGHGHGVRSTAICNSFSDKVTVTVRTRLSKQFFTEEMTRPFRYTSGEFDCGCIQSDGITVDIEKTLRTYMRIADENECLLEKEVTWCLDNKVDGIISDIAPFPFAVARKSHIPSIAVSNFSWYDIYKPYLQIMPEFKTYLETIKSQYEMAGLLLALSPANPMVPFSRRIDVPLVAKSGQNRRAEICDAYDINAGKTIGLIYTGNFGMDSVLWKKLELLDGWEFLGVNPLPESPENYHLVKKLDFQYRDLSASVDCIISKIGYGIYSECLSNGVPLLYVPRIDFAEHPFLEKAVLAWGYGHPLEKEDFYALNWKRVLTQIQQAGPAEKADSQGASYCADKIESFVKGSDF